MRIDKFLWSIRFYKTRTLASEEIKKNRVSIGEQKVKTSKEVKNIFDKNPFEKDVNFHIYSFITIPDFETELLKNFNETERTEGEQAEILNKKFLLESKKRFYFRF